MADVTSLRAQWGSFDFTKFVALNERLEKLEAGATVEAGPCTECPDKDGHIADLEAQIGYLSQSIDELRSEVLSLQVQLEEAE